MSDTYQPIYDAFAHRLHDLDLVVSEYKRPCVLFRPKIYMDGDMWCALYGDDLVRGVAGFGATPEIAMRQFDIAWSGYKTEKEVNNG